MEVQSEIQKKQDYFQYTECKSVYILGGITIGIIFIYWGFLLKENEGELIQHDFMNKIIFKIPGIRGCCGFWTLSHVILFFILGIFFPHCGKPILVGGVLWEFFEMGMSKYSGGPAYAHVFGKKSKSAYKDDLQYGDVWWDWSIADVFSNVLGFYIGKWVGEWYRKRKLQKNKEQSSGPPA